MRYRQSLWHFVEMGIRSGDLLVESHIDGLEGIGLQVLTSSKNRAIEFHGFLEWFPGALHCFRLV